ncbi:MAG: pyridoxamine 5'-phosphate oxidase family protein [Dehalococcoidia bacterium]|nr:pyridoxamine 5'-phosphate oxidase family protein [Dehalococcoidia bacterium]
MATWKQFTDEAPELAAAVHARFAATKHHVLATLRADGSPRVSGTEVAWHGDWLTCGSMLNARKARDLQRDPRFALHANPGDGSMEGGDAKLAGRAIEVTDAVAIEAARHPDVPDEPFHLFRFDIEEVVLTTVDGDDLVVQTWKPGKGVTRFARK